MHQTTIRFAPDVWAQLESEARDGGVSAAQYVRDAVVARLAYADARRNGPDAVGHVAATRKAAARAASVVARDGAQAVWAQAQLARSRAQLTRETAQTIQQAVRTQRQA
jgi:hypothetical protein